MARYLAAPQRRCSLGECDRALEWAHRLMPRRRRGLTAGNCRRAHGEQIMTFPEEVGHGGVAGA